MPSLALIVCTILAALSLFAFVRVVRAQLHQLNETSEYGDVPHIPAEAKVAAARPKLGGGGALIEQRPFAQEAIARSHEGAL